MAQTIPTGWEEKTLGEICVIIAGQSPNSQFYNTEANGLPFYQGKKEFTNKYIGTPSVWTTETTKEALPGDILMSVRAPVGPINYATERCCIGRGLASIRNGELISKDFLFYYLLSIQQKIGGHDGAVFNSISRNEISALKILLPSLSEQERIVAKLDKAFEAIDKVKANAEQNLNNTKELFNNTLDSKIRTLYKNSSTQKLSEVCDVRDGTHDSPKYLDKRGHPFVTSKNLKNDKIDMEKITYISDSDFEKINERSKVDIGDVLFAMIGTIGNPVVITEEPDFAIKNVALFKNINKLEPQYLKFLLKSPSVLLKMQLEANGTTQKFVSLKYLRNFMVPVPSLSEQQKIVEKLDVLQEQTKKLEQIYIKKIKDLDELKQSILQKAFRGEL